MAGMTLDDAADELYAGPPSDFVRRRTELVAAARAEGEREVAAAIAGLRKPTTGAWLANLLCREYRAELEELMALGEGLREAQDVLDPDQLRQLGRQRHQVIRRLVALAGFRAVKDGHVPGRSADEELEATLNAALADPAAAEQLLSGRMTSGLSYAGLGFGATASARPATKRSGPAPPPAPRSVRAESADKGESAQAAARAARIDAAERDLAQARLQEAAAAAEADTSLRRFEQAKDSLAAASETLERLTRELGDAEASVRGAKEELSAATREHSATTRGAALAARRCERAEQSLQALRTH
jgi:hypothetical protein